MSHFVQSLRGVRPEFPRDLHMFPRVFHILLLCALWPGSLHAQTGVRPPQGWSLSGFAGGAAFTDFQRAAERRIGAETSGSFAANLAFWPTRHWGIRARIGYAPSRFETIDPQADRDTTPRLASLSITSYEGQLIFRLPTIHGRVMPYGIAGGGIVRYQLGEDAPLPEEAVNGFSTGQQPAVSVGLGAALPLRPSGWSLNFELTDQISRTPMPTTTSDRIKTTSTVTFMVGASWNFWK